MAKDISELFDQAINKFRARQDQVETQKEVVLSTVERDFEAVKEQVRLLKPRIEKHPAFDRFWVFEDRILIAFRPQRNIAPFEVILRRYLPSRIHTKEGIYGYMPDGYEMKLASIDDAVEFVAVQCGKLLA